MIHSKTCNTETIVKNRVAHIQRCASCGCISIHLGHLSVRLDEAAACELSKALLEATAVIAQDSFPSFSTCTPNGIVS